ncbi:hypothetical protein ACROYT_G041966 [Oculina patagonica]
MASCGYACFVGGACGPSSFNPANVACVAISDCRKDVRSHLVYCKISDDSGVDNEAKLLLTRAAICRQCREYLINIMSRVTVSEDISEPVESSEVPSEQEEQEKSDKSAQEEEGDISAASDEDLTAGLGRMTISDDSPVFSPESASTVSSSGEGSGFARVVARPREAFNIFLNHCQIQPLGRPWLEWGEVSVRTRQRYVQRSSEIVSAVLKVVSPNNAPHLWKALQTSATVNQQLGLHEASHPSEVAYLEALAESYSNATSWDTRRQVLSVMSGVASFKAISEFIPGLTQYRYTMAKLHSAQYGRHAPVPKSEAPRLRIDANQLDHFLGFITSPHLVQDLPFGEKHLQLSSGKIITVPNIIRTMIPERIVMQYMQYCSENSFKPFSRSTMLRILTECSASVRKSLQGLDYFVAEGARAFDDLASIVEDISSLRADSGEWASRIKESLKAGKLYLKSDFKVHVDSSARVADHCSVYALSDPTENAFKQRCDHNHDELCDQCQALNSALQEVGEAVENTKFHNEDERDEILFLYEAATRSVKAWKAHLLRSVQQDKSRIDILELLNDNTVLIVNDWAMKFLPQLYRESQQDWFGKRGISWHISVAFRRKDGELQSQAFVHIVQSCSQDSVAVVLMIQHVLKTLKTECPDITMAYLRQDNAGCYHCANTVVACPKMEQSTGIKIAGLDFSDPQGGKGAADRLAATCKSHIRIYLNEGHDVTTAEEMKQALLSHGGVQGVRVAHLLSINQTVEPQKISGISKLNNFQFTDGSFQAWRAYGIGSGKGIGIENVSDVNYSWLSVLFSPGGFKAVSGRQTKPPKVQVTTDDQQQCASTESPQSSVFSCPKEGCVKVFQRSSALERHLSLDSCVMSPERHTLMDLAKLQYAVRLQEGVGVLPSLQATSSANTSSQGETVQEGWALKEVKKAYRFNEKQKSYLDAKFDIGESTGRKMEADAVAKEMRRARGTNGERLFSVSEFLIPQQVSSYFSRLAAKRRQQQVEVTLEDALAAEEQENFSQARENVMSALHIRHPIIVDQYEICSLVTNRAEFQKTKLGMLQHLCQSLELDVPVPAVRRKAPYMALLEELVDSCPCRATK